MAFGAEVGSGHVSIFPVMTGFRKAVNREVIGAGKEASKTFTKNFDGSKNGSAIGKAFKTGFNQSANNLAADVLKGYQKDVAQATSSYKTAMLQQKAAANQVQAAEEKLAAATEKHGATSTQAQAASIRLEQARLKLEQATEKTTTAETKLKTAQKALADAQTALAKTTEQDANTISNAFKTLGHTIAEPALNAIEKIRAGWSEGEAALLDGAGVFGRIGSLARSGFDTVANAAQSLSGKVKSGMSNVGLVMQATALQIGAPILRTFDNLGQSIAAKIPAPMKNAVNSIGQYLGRVGTAAGNVFSKIPPAVSNVASRMANTIKNGAGQALTAIQNMAGKSVNALKGIATIGLAGIGAATAALAGIGKSALDAYATYEQAVGGVDTLFKDASGKVQQYAAEAYKTAGVSANQYMQQVTSFSASLISSMGGDTQAAADRANMALTDMSDNANKMGTDLESIQQTYQSLARGNYAMLDNLKLGYGGTKTEMERLIADANKLKQANGEAADLSVDSFADVVEAIHLVQENLGITGTTAKEAATTIEGSVGAMKAAWQNWLTELGKDNADIQGLTTQLVDSVSTVIQNVAPRIAQIITGVTAALPQLVGAIGSALPQLVSQIAPPLLAALGQLGTMVITGATTWIQTGLPQLLTQFQTWVTTTLPTFLQTGLTMVTTLLQGAVNAIPQIITTATTVITTLLNGLAAQLPQLVPIGFDAVLNVVQGLLDNLPQIIDTGLQLLEGLAEGFVNALPNLISKIPQMIGQLVTTIISNLPQILQSGVRILSSLMQGFVSAIPQLIGQIPGIIGQIWNAFTSVNWLDVGINIIKGIASGVASAAWSLVQAAADAVGNALNWVKGLLGIHSPSRVFRDQVGEMIGLGMAEGIDESAKKVTKAAGRLTDIIPTTGEYRQDVSPSIARQVGAGNVTNVNQTFNYPAVAPSVLSINERLDLAAMPKW